MKARANKIGVLLCLALLAFSTVALGVMPVFATQYELASDWFDTKFVTLQMQTQAPDADDRRAGIRLTATQKKATATFSKTFAGEFSLDYYAYGSGNKGLSDVRFTFSAVDTGEQFSVVRTQKSGGCTYAIVGESGVYSVGGYDEGVAASGGADVLKFDPNTLTVSVNGTKIWSFATYRNSHYTNDFIFDGFSKYNVKIEFVDAVNGNLLIYTVNGQYLSDQVVYKDTSAPTIYARAKANGVVGQTYVLPKPYAFDAIDGEIPSTEIDYALSGASGKLQSGKYEDGASFTPTAAGNYSVTYTARDSMGQERSVKATFEVFESVPDIDFEARGTLKDYAIGKGGTLYFPRVNATSTLSNGCDSFVTVSLFKDGSVVEEVDGVVANGTSYTFATAGEYEVVYKADYNGIMATTSFAVSVSADAPCLTLSEELPISVVTGDTYKLPEGEMTLGDKQAVAEKRTIFPSGAKYKGSIIEFFEYGYYQIEYSATIDDVKYSEIRWIKAITGSADVFGETSAQIESGELTRNGVTRKGVVVTESLGSSGITYAFPIDLSDNTRDDVIVSLCAFPFVNGKPDFRGFEIKLVDIEDKANSISIMSTVPSWATAANQNFTYTKISHSGLDYVGVETPDKVYNGSSQYGYYSNHSFNGYDTNNPTLLRIAMDYETKRIYIDTATTGRGLGDGAATDLDSLALYSKPWKGFTNGKCYLTITATNYVGGSARYLITNVDGFDLSGTYLNYSAPTIDVDLAGNTTVPHGLVLNKYPLFKAKAANTFGESLRVQTSVFYGYGTDKAIEIDVSDGAFLPKSAGTYTIVYTAKDGFDHVATQTVDVVVTADEEEFTLSVANSSQSGYMGVATELQTLNSEGNCGVVVIDEVTVVHSESQTAVAAVDGAFIMESAGEYTVTYKAHDWIGRKAEVSYSVTATPNPDPIFQGDLTLKQVYAVGETYVLPKITAKDYSGDSAKNAAVSITVSYGDDYLQEIGADRVFTPVSGHGKEITVTYRAQAAGGGSNEISDSAVLVEFNSQSGQISIPDYFAKNNVEIVPAQDRMKHIAQVVDTTKSASFAFAKPLLAESLLVRMLIPASSNGFDGLKVTLTDADDASVRVELDIRKKDTKSTLVVGDEDGVNMAGSFWGFDAQLGSKNYLQLRYKDSTRQIIDATGSTITGIMKDTLGRDFDGFPSGKVYVSFEFEGIETNGAAAVELHALNNQALSNLNIDITKPEFVINGEYGGMASFGDEVILPTMMAVDVLGYIKSVNVTVTDASGQVVVATDGTRLQDADASRSYTIKLTQYGQYRISYSATDNNNNKSEPLTKVLYVMKTDKPEFTVAAEIASKAKLGDEIVLPEAYLTDVVNHKYNVVVIDPNFTHTVVFSTVAPDGDTDLKYTWKYKGKHIVRYYVYDQYGNYTIKDFVVTVE